MIKELKVKVKKVMYAMILTKCVFGMLISLP